jgi:transposase InsO family protein
MESFFALLQRNVLDRHRWNNQDELRIAIVTWIERTHHRRRRQAALNARQSRSTDTTRRSRHR